MADPIEEIIGGYRAFAAQQRDRLAARGIDIDPGSLIDSMCVATASMTPVRSGVVIGFGLPSSPAGTR